MKIIENKLAHKLGYSYIAIMKFLLAFTLVICFFTIPVQISANISDFSTQLVTNYYIERAQTTRVEQNIVITNLTSSAYVDEFALEIAAEELIDLSVKQINGQQLPHNVITTNNRSIVTISFPNPVIGRDAQLKIQLSYLQEGVVQEMGQVIEISIPKQRPNQQITDVITHLHVPEDFGSPTHLFPESQFSETNNDVTIYTFIHTQESAGVIRAIFGDKQTLNFTLNYHLENTTINRGIAQITIPPDTAYQKMFYSHINPLPDQISRDDDGNWLATYSLAPKQELHVLVQGKVELFLTPTNPVPINTNNLTRYLNPLPFWDSQEMSVKNLANELKTPENIYNYIVENFTYNYQKLDSSERLGGSKALQQPENAVCLEFSDSFISLARAAGIPARSHTGYAYTSNPNLRPLSLVKDVLHAWPEYFDFQSNQWVPVDPTWGNTTGGVDYFNQLDLNHFTFAIHGLDSTRPYPAGYYKFDQVSEKDILIEFANEPASQTGEVVFEIKPNMFHLLGLPWPAKMNVINNTNVALYNLDININESNWRLKQQQFSLESILPFSNSEFSIMLRSPRLYYTNQSYLNLTYDDQNYQISFRIQPIHQVYFWVSSLALVGLCVCLAYITGRLLVSKRR